MAHRCKLLEEVEGGFSRVLKKLPAAGCDPDCRVRQKFSFATTSPRSQAGSLAKRSSIADCSSHIGATASSVSPSTSRSATARNAANNFGSDARPLFHCTQRDQPRGAALPNPLTCLPVQRFRSILFTFRAIPAWQSHQPPHDRLVNVADQLGILTSNSASRSQ